MNKRQFGAAFRNLCAAMTADQRADTLRSIDDQRRTATSSEEIMLDCLQQSLLEVWTENAPQRMPPAIRAPQGYHEESKPEYLPASKPLDSSAPDMVY